MTYRYFVSYAYERGFGNTEIFTSTPLTDMDTLNKVRDLIEDDGGGQGVIILTYIPLGAPDRPAP